MKTENIIFDFGGGGCKLDYCFFKPHYYSTFQPGNRMACYGNGYPVFL